MPNWKPLKRVTNTPKDTNKPLGNLKVNKPQHIDLFGDDDKVKNSKPNNVPKDKSDTRA